MSGSINRLPGPWRLPGLGNALQVKPSHLHLTAERWSQLYGPVFRFDIGKRPVVAIADKDAIQAILRDRPEGFRRWHEVEEVLKEMGISGVFSAEGRAWQEQRRFAITALNSNHLRSYFEVIQIATERLYGRLQAAARADKPVAILQDLASYTVDVTSALAFGHDLNTLELGNSELQLHIEKVFHGIAHRVSAPFPYWRFMRLPADRALDRALTELRSTVSKFIEQARGRIRERPELRERPENFLESVLVASENGAVYDNEELFGNALTMLLAGEDTTSSALAWTIWFLARKPAIQARLAGEAQELLGDLHCPDRYEAVADMDYGEAVLRESLRLKSPAPVIFIESLKQTEIAGVTIPANTHLLLLTRYASMQEANFVRPSEFDPARWLEENDDTHDATGFIAFGAGPRFCPGRNLAFLEAKAALSMLVRNFEITLEPGGKSVKEVFSFTMRPSKLYVRLRERAHAC